MKFHKRPSDASKSAFRRGICLYIGHMKRQVGSAEKYVGLSISWIMSKSQFHASPFIHLTPIMKFSMFFYGNSESKGVPCGMVISHIAYIATLILELEIKCKYNDLVSCELSSNIYSNASIPPQTTWSSTDSLYGMDAVIVCRNVNSLWLSYAKWLHIFGIILA